MIVTGGGRRFKKESRRNREFSVTGKNHGRPEWIRTIDLFRVNSFNGAWPSDNE
jgi:hypothetical protein